MRKLITTRTHGLLDYLTSATLMALPRAMGWSNASKGVFDTSALTSTGCSLITDYEYSAVRILPMKAHLAMDAVSGSVLITAGSLMAREPRATRAALMGFGLFEIAAALLTRTQAPPSARRKRRLVRQTIGMIAARQPEKPGRLHLQEVPLGGEI